jgi:hypothetical protein
MSEVSQKMYVKDIQIVRQSQVKLVYDFLMNKGINPTVEELQRVTDIFTSYCMMSPDEAMKDRVKKLDKWIEEKSTN